MRCVFVSVLALAWLSACASGPGEMAVDYPTGERRFRVATVDGEPHGPSTTWRRDGTVASRGSYRDGLKDGVFEYYDEIGRVERRVLYREGRTVWESSRPDEPVPLSITREIDHEVVREKQKQRKERIEVLRARPSFATSEWVQGFSGADARLDAAFLTGVDVGERLSAGGEWLPGRLGLYGRLSSSSQGMLVGDFQHGKTVVEVGGLARHLSSDYVLLARAGAFASIAGDDLGGFMTERAVDMAPVRDVVYSWPNAAGARLSASAVRRRGPLYARADAGLDLVHDAGGDDDYPRIDGGDVVMRLHAGLGALVGFVIITGELALARNLTGDYTAPSSAALSFHLPRLRVQPTVSFTVPIRDGAFADALGVTVGVRWTFDER